MQKYKVTKKNTGIVNNILKPWKLVETICIRIC